MAITHMDRFNALLTSSLEGHTTDGLVVVTLDDIGPAPFFYVKSSFGKIYKGTIDDKNVFYEANLNEKLAKLKEENEKRKLEEELKAKRQAQLAALQVYVFEVECGGSNAAGGGCGAPLEVRKVSKKEFDEKKGTSGNRFYNFNDSELSENILSAQREGYLNIKGSYRACTSCRMRC